MKRIQLFGLLTLMLLSSAIVNAQVDSKRKLEEDFENYKKFREQDFEAFKKKREEELKKMEQEYQDFYNEMMGLKKYYTAKKDTAKVNVVNDIISYETKVSAALGKPLKVTEEVKIENSNANVQEQKTNQQEVKKEERNQQKKQSFKEAYQQQTQNKENEKQQNQNVQVVSNKEEKKENTNTQQATTTTQNTNEKTEDLSLANLPSAKRRGLPVLTPVPKIKSKITSPFGFRNHPTLGRPMKHNGVDFGTGRGAEIYSAADGKVVLAENNRSFGNYIVVEHKDGHSSAYAHLESMKVTKGSSVSKGQLLGYSGSTGRSSGPHLHYEVRINGTPVNPKDFLVETK